MNKQEVIEKLKQHGAWCTECHDINGEADRYVKAAKVRELLEQLDEPQAEKVEVTERQAQLLEAYEGETLCVLLCVCKTEEEELLAKAKLFGYTVKPKRWVIKNTDGDTCYLKRFRIGDDCIDGESSGWIGERVRAFTFDDRTKAEAVATLVEGSVEEV